MENNKKKVPTLKSEGDVRAEIIKDYGLDPNEEANKPFVEKLVKERMETEKKISTAIGQKINYRKAKEFYKTNAKKAGINPKTGEPVKKEKNQEPPLEEKFITKEEYEKDRLRRQYSDLNDEEFEFVNSYAKGKGVKFKEALEDKFVKNYFETNDANNRIAEATHAPSNRFKSNEHGEEDKIAKEFDRDLPVGFTTKKN